MSGTSQRLLTLLSLFQARRDWPGQVLAERLDVSARTVRRDVERLRDLGYPIAATKGPDGGYRLEAGAELPPLLFDDEQAIALVVGLHGAVMAGAGIGEAAARALATVRQVMPSRLRLRIDTLPVRVIPPGGGRLPDVAPAVLLALADAVRASQVLRMDYAHAASASQEADPGTGTAPARRVEPHQLLLRNGRWYLLAWDLDRNDWRTFRADRITPRSPLGDRFRPRPIPGGDAAAFVAARFKGASSNGTSGAHDEWPCRGRAVLFAPASSVAPYVGDGQLQVLGPDRCLLTVGAWSWPGLAAAIARYGVDFEILDPPALREATVELARRCLAAAGRHPPE